MSMVLLFESLKLIRKLDVIGVHLIVNLAFDLNISFLKIVLVELNL